MYIYIYYIIYIYIIYNIYIILYIYIYIYNYIYGASIEWSNGCRYLGIFVTLGATFKCKFDAAKAKFYRSFNAIMDREGSCASLEVLFSLMRSKCVPTLLYGIEACPVNTMETRSLEYPIICAFFKILKTSSSNLVNECRLAFGFRQFSHVIADRKNFFNLKYISSNYISFVKQFLPGL